MEEDTATTEEIVANLKESEPVPDAQPTSADFNKDDEGDEVADSKTTSTTYRDRP